MGSDAFSKLERELLAHFSRDVATEPHTVSYEVVANFTVEAGKKNTLTVP